LAGQDQETGLSLVKIAGRDLPFLRPAPAEEVALGQAAVIISSTGEAERRVSGGYITSFDAFDGQWEYMLDKSIRLNAFNPGFGGGTLVDLKGRLLGVVSLNLNEVGKFSLAIPIEYYLKIEQELKTFGRIRAGRPGRGWDSIPNLAGHIVIPVLPRRPRKAELPEISSLPSTRRDRSRPELYREIWKKKPETGSMRILQKKKP
jgi:S1-C subfamily serine protease